MTHMKGTWGHDFAHRPFDKTQHTTSCDHIKVMLANKAIMAKQECKSPWGLTWDEGMSNIMLSLSFFKNNIIIFILCITGN